MNNSNCGFVLFFKGALQKPLNLITNLILSLIVGAFPASALYARRDRLQRPSHVATKTFQALRISVNNELNELQAGLSVAQTLLCPKG